MEVVEAHRKYLGFDGPYVFSKLMHLPMVTANPPSGTYMYGGFDIY